MTSLIERIESAAEGSRELDAAIWFSGCALVTSAIKDGHEDYGGVRRSHWSAGSIGIWDDELPHYTTSIDAALALVPEGYRIRLWQHHTGVWGCDVFPDQGGAVHRVHDALTPALALCAAALKAGEHLKEEGR